MTRSRLYRSESAACLLVLFALLPIASCSPDATTAPGKVTFAKGGEPGKPPRMLATWEVGPLTTSVSPPSSPAGAVVCVIHGPFGTNWSLPYPDAIIAADWVPNAPEPAVLGCDQLRAFAPQVLEFNALNSPDFDEFASRLTDGAVTTDPESVVWVYFNSVGNNLYDVWGPSGGHGKCESLLAVKGRRPGVSCVAGEDFQGYAIDFVRLTLGEFEISTTGYTTTVRYQYVLEIFGR